MSRKKIQCGCRAAKPVVDVAQVLTVDGSQVLRETVRCAGCGTTKTIDTRKKAKATG